MEEEDADVLRNETSDILEMMDDTRLMGVVRQSNFDLIVIDGYY